MVLGLSSCRGVSTIWDPLRQKHVAHTPEEGVRQWFIGLLLERYGVERWRMVSEYTVMVGGRRLRADVVIFGFGSTRVHAVVECKAPGVCVDQLVIDQAIVYGSVLGARVYVVTNGTTTLAWDLVSGVSLGCLDGVFG